MSTIEETEIQIYKNQNLSFHDKQILVFVNDYIQSDTEVLKCNIYDVSASTSLKAAEVIPAITNLEKKGFIHTSSDNGADILISLNTPFLTEFLNDGGLYYV